MDFNFFIHNITRGTKYYYKLLYHLKKAEIREENI